MGVLGIVAGVVTFAAPGLTALSLLYIVAFWAITTGTFQVVAAVALRREIDRRALDGHRRRRVDRRSARC